MSDAAPAVAAPVASETTPTDVGGTSEPVATTEPTGGVIIEPKKEIPPAPRKLKAKIYGEEREISAEYVEGMAKELNIPPEFVLRNLQTSAAAQKRMQEVAEKEKVWAERSAKLKADPWTAFEGMDPDQAAIARVQAIMEREQMSPEQRAMAEAQRIKAEYEGKSKTFEEQQQQAKHQAETQQHITKLNAELPAAAEAAGLPKTPATGRLMIEFMLSQARAGVQVDPADAAQYARETVQNWTGEVIKGMDGPQLERFLGPETIKAILTHAVAKVRGQSAAPAVQMQGQPAKAERPWSLSPDEWAKKYG